ncbi:MAG: hypothetical protein J0H68_09485 [Sphingobacteriia bacterium]|nr:hypothetical protein [Sphingobacteriia bacterium]
MKEIKIKSFELYMLENAIDIEIIDEVKLEYSYCLNEDNARSIKIFDLLALNHFFKQITEETFELSNEIENYLPENFTNIDQYERELKDNLVNYYINNIELHYKKTLFLREKLYSHEQKTNEEFLEKSKEVLKKVFKYIEFEDMLPPLLTWIDKDNSSKKYNNFGKITKYLPFLKKLGAYSNHLENYVDADTITHSSEISLTLPLRLNQVESFISLYPEYKDLFSPIIIDEIIHRYNKFENHVLIPKVQNGCNLVRMKDAKSLIQFQDTIENYKSFLIGTSTLTAVGLTTLAVPNFTYILIMDKVIPAKLGIGFLATKAVKPTTEFFHGNFKQVRTLINEGINLAILTDPNWSNEIKLSKFLRRNFNAEFAKLSENEICLIVPKKSSITLNKFVNSISNLCIIEEKFLLPSFKVQFTININNLQHLIQKLTNLYQVKDILNNNFNHIEKGNFQINLDLEIEEEESCSTNKLIGKIIEVVGNITYENAIEKRSELQKLENLVLMTKGTILKLLKLEQSNTSLKLIRVTKEEIKKNLIYLNQLIDQEIIQIKYNSELELYDICIINFRNVKQLLSSICFFNNVLECNIRNELFLEFEGVSIDTPSPSRNYLIVPHNINITGKKAIAGTIVSLKDLKKAFMESLIIRDSIIKKHFNEFDFQVFLLSIKEGILESISKILPLFSNSLIKLELQKRDDPRNKIFTTLLKEEDFALNFAHELKTSTSKTSDFFFTNVRSFSVKCILKVLNLLMKENYINYASLNYNKEAYEKELENLNTLGVPSSSNEKRDRITTFILPLGSQTYKEDNLKSYSDLEKLDDSQYSYNYLKRYAMNQIFRNISDMSPNKIKSITNKLS